LAKKILSKIENENDPNTNVIPKNQEIIIKDEIKEEVDKENSQMEDN
jgi:hypothetical protein